MSYDANLNMNALQGIISFTKEGVRKRHEIHVDFGPAVRQRLIAGPT
jgi:hypothetical protein